MSILLFIIILVALILVHELGHFVVAKRFGIRVDEFGVGFPPRIFAKKYGETEYSVNALPLGGFVKIFGENPDNESISGPDRSRSFVNKPKVVQSGVLLAGVVFNILFAWPLLSAAYMIGVPSTRDGAPAGATVRDVALMATQILPGSPAEEAGLKPGDKILSLSSHDATLQNPSPDNFLEFTQGHEGQEVALGIKRGEETLTLTATPTRGVIAEAKETPAIGIAIDEVGIVRLPFFAALLEGAKFAGVLTKETTVGLAGFFADIFRGHPDLESVAGPVGIAGIVSDASALGVSYILTLAAIISINLGLINLLPIPALDGGRFLFVIIEAIKGSPIKPKIANAIHSISFALLILLILIVTYNDILRLVK